ncbi:hypothetical protein FSP39_000730 [Pinctada imbricata]|uniref:Uncharacterized protein n=1 Tax=Pinctada imbricata TaxID=66713 RepID=A0AA89C024_PINIB|nr:hypothetical protein FSP39_000730 [Pinctada imbricata]
MTARGDANESETEVEGLNEEIRVLQEKIKELEALNALADESELNCFYEGKYNNEIRGNNDDLGYTVCSEPEKGYYTCDSRAYSLELAEVGSGDAASLMTAFREQISELASAIQVGDKGVPQLITSIVSTMSDQGSTNPVFNSQLAELRLSLSARNNS